MDADQQKVEQAFRDLGFQYPVVHRERSQPLVWTGYVEFGAPVDVKEIRENDREGLKNLLRQRLSDAISGILK